ncbi:MAG: PEP-CTERM sorting domain-containing protein [Kiritimatiellae bacterium]|nr:PEP-CTERM sorting domain-containing protein [Kiritimatiellia bacterium]
MKTQTSSYSTFTSMVTSTTLTMLLVAFTSISHADVIQWGGGDGEYTTPANWAGGVLPNTAGGDTAQINGGNVTYTPGGDIAINNGGVLQLNGGSWTQVDSVAWIQLGGGTLDVSGGVFNQGTAGNIVRTAATTISVSSGTANFTGNLIHDTTNLGTLSVSGGALNVENEFKPISDFYMSAGNMNANLISFADGPGSIYFSGGTIEVNGQAAFNGIYGGGVKSIDFGIGSSGGLFYENLTLTEFSSSGHLSNGTIRYNGTISEADFSVVESGSGVLISVIPEPSTLGLVAMSLLASIVMIRKRN